MARIAAEAGDDGTNDVIVSDVIRQNDLQVWFVAGHLLDQGGRAKTLGVQAPHAQVDDRSPHPARLIGSHEDRHVSHLR